ncbi:hypothetical protein [Amycolatopsis sp. lyj-346]|uniref:hypothetical protein n=1 Tax=Amycolatopsis sp. lyj-346 TaxID=2789289 RepID=UPI00397DFA58
MAGSFIASTAAFTAPQLWCPSLGVGRLSGRVLADVVEGLRVQGLVDEQAFVAVQEALQRAVGVLGASGFGSTGTTEPGALPAALLAPAAHALNASETPPSARPRSTVLRGLREGFPLFA